MSVQKVNLFKSTVSTLNHRFFSLSHSLAKTFREKYRDFWTSESPVNSPPYNHFTQVGDPVLRLASAAVPDELITSKEIECITEQMVKVLHKYDCVGIAAPQIGISLRIIAIEFREELKKKFTETVYETRKMSTLPMTIVINPTLKITNYTKHRHPEGCMSVRGFSAEVERYEAVTLKGVDTKGSALELPLHGWNARIAQHEMDHLDGKLYIDQMDRSTFICTCWEAVNKKSGRVEIPFYK